MADTKLANLPAVTVPAGTDLIYCEQSSTAKKVTISQYANYGATDNAILRADGTGTVTAQGSAVTIADTTGTITLPSAGGVFWSTDTSISRLSAGVVSFDTTVAGNGLGTASASFYKSPAGVVNSISTVAAAQTASTTAGLGLTITADAAVAGSTNAGAAAGGSVTITAGAAAQKTSGNAAGGDIILAGGAGVGTGRAGVVQVPIGTAAVPGLAFIGNTNTGFYERSSNRITVALNGAAEHEFQTTGFMTNSDNSICFSSSTVDAAGQGVGFSFPTTAVISVDSTSVGNGLGKLLFRVLTEDNTAGSGSPNILLASETNTYLFNTGSSAQNYHTLPTAVVGLQFTFVVTDSDGIRITAPGAATIRVGGNVTAAGGHIDSTTVGDSVTLVAYSTTQWIATAIVGGGALYAPGWTAT